MIDEKNTTAPSRSEDPFRHNEERFRMLVEGVGDYAIFLLDPDGIIRSWNTGAERIKGYKADEIIGKHFSIFYPQERIDEGWPEHELKMARKDGRFEDEGWRLRKDGTRFWANVIITALFDQNGELQGFSKITRDLTERKQYEEELRQSEERFRLLVEGVVDYAIFMLSPEGIISSWNLGAERIKGYKADEIIGKHFSIFYPQERIAEGWPEHELKMARKEGRFEDEGWRLRKDGTRFWANVIITALFDSGGKLRGFTKVTRDMTERKRVEALELAERRMTEFLAMLSHELRNPLAPIRNAVSIMQMIDLNDDLRWSADVIDRQVTHLTRLVEDLLEVSRVTSGKIKLQKERMDLSDAIARAVEASRPLIDSRRHTLELSLTSKKLPVNGDMTRLTQVVMNLLNNAAKYTPREGRINLYVEREEGQAMIRVRDNGMGIPEDFLGRMFDLFAQGERALDRSDGGLGIGLTLVRRIVEMHDGTVDAFSNGPGTGSEFVVRIPLLADQPERSVGNTTRAGQAGNGGGVRVLVVDDHRDIAESMVRYLSILGYDVRSVGNGEAALDSVQTFRPDVVLLDIGLPGMSGYEVAAAIRQMPETEGITLLAMTGYGQEEDRRLTRQAGFAQHLVKPVEGVMLQKLLASIVAQRNDETR